MSPADLADIRWALRELEAPKIDAYAEITVLAGTHPDESTEAATYPPGEWEDVGPWQPYATTTIDVDHDDNGRCRTVPARCWRRALREVAP